MTTKNKSRDQDGLSIREKLFAYLYLSNKGNGAQAAREAGYSGDHKNRATDLLAKPQVKAVIDRERARLMDKAQINAERVLQELARLAFYRFSRAFKPDGTPITPSELDDDTAAAVCGFEVRNGGVVKYRWANKLQALDLLGRWLKLWDGSGDSSSDRLRDVIEAFKAGAADKQNIQ